MYLLAKKLGFADQMFKNIKVENNVPGRRGHPARDQPRRLVDRLLRPVAGAAQGAHEEPGQVRPGHVARAEGPARDRRRLLRPAVAVLGHAGAPASRHAHALQHQPARHGWRRHVPRPLRRRARGQDQGHGERRGGREGGEAQSSRRRLVLLGLGNQGRLSGVHARRAEEARLGQGPDRSRTGGDPARSIRPRPTRCRGRSICRAASSASR